MKKTNLDFLPNSVVEQLQIRLYFSLRAGHKQVGDLNDLFLAQAERISDQIETLVGKRKAEQIWNAVVKRVSAE